MTVFAQPRSYICEVERDRYIIRETICTCVCRAMYIAWVQLWEVLQAGAALHTHTHISTYIVGDAAVCV